MATISYSQINAYKDQFQSEAYAISSDWRATEAVCAGNTSAPAFLGKVCVALGGLVRGFWVRHERFEKLLCMRTCLHANNRVGLLPSVASMVLAEIVLKPKFM